MTTFTIDRPSQSYEFVINGRQRPLLLPPRLVTLPTINVYTCAILSKNLKTKNLFVFQGCEIPEALFCMHV